MPSTPNHGALKTGKLEAMDHEGKTSRWAFPWMRLLQVYSGWHLSAFNFFGGCFGGITKADTTVDDAHREF